MAEAFDQLCSTILAQPAPLPWGECSVFSERKALGMIGAFRLSPLSKLLGLTKQSNFETRILEGRTTLKSQVSYSKAHASLRNCISKQMSRNPYFYFDGAVRVPNGGSHESHALLLKVVLMTGCGHRVELWGAIVHSGGESYESEQKEKEVFLLLG